jgi:uncharacterized protein with FMN-binding domain
MKKFGLSIAALMFVFCLAFAQGEGGGQPAPKAATPLEIVKKVYPATTKIVKINNVWNKAVDKKGKLLGYVLNSTEYSKDIRGFRGPVPVVVVTDKAQKIRKIAALGNHETPAYFKRAASLMSKWNGKSIQKAKDAKVDGVTGATFSSNAIIKNVQLISKKASEKKPK